MVKYKVSQAKEDCETAMTQAVTKAIDEKEAELNSTRELAVTSDGDRTRETAE